MTTALDASALLAWLQGETGADQVDEALKQGAVIHVVNWAEVLTRRTLISGDAFQTLAGLSVTSELKWRFPFPALATWHAPTALESARTLYRLQPARLAAGHGPVVEHPAEGIGLALGRAERALSSSVRRQHTSPLKR